jgi:hypothetical protein
MIMFMSKKSRELTVLANEIASSMAKAKAYKARGQLTLADEQMDRALRLHVRRQNLMEPKCRSK